MKAHLAEAAAKLTGARVVVLGDLVLDEFLYGEIARVSREAPVLIIEQRRMDAMPGGGGNAISNVLALGGIPLPVGVVGNDEAGRRLVASLQGAGVDTSGVTVLQGYSTPIKTRVLAGLPHSRPQQVIRIDRGGDARVDLQSAEAAAERARAQLPAAAGLLLSDYGFDAITPESAAPLIAASRAARVPVTCDSRRRARAYKGVTAITPNLEETEQMLGGRLDDAGVSLEKRGRDLLHMLDCRAVLITRGSHGMTLVEDGVKPFDIPVHGGDQVADVTGAGDTVIAAFTLALASGATFRLAALLSNIAAGIVVMKRGTAVASGAELRAAIAALDETAPA